MHTDCLLAEHFNAEMKCGRAHGGRTHVRCHIVKPYDDHLPHYSAPVRHAIAFKKAILHSNFPLRYAGNSLYTVDQVFFVQDFGLSATASGNRRHGPPCLRPAAPGCLGEFLSSVLYPKNVEARGEGFEFHHWRGRIAWPAISE